ncbi:MAG: hypothetical protein ABH843_01790 [Candidatus Omnitrophota bacterium]
MYKIMKVTILIFCLVVFCGRAMAAPVSGTHPIVDGSIVALAGEYDFVYDRDLKSSDTASGIIDEQNTCYLKLVFKAIDLVSVYVKAGATSFKLESKMNDGTTIREDYSAGFYTGGGAKLVHEFIPRVRFAADAQLNWWSCNIDEAEYVDSGGRIISSNNGDTSAFEVQLAGILSYEIDYQSLVHPVHGGLPLMIPYIGLKYSHLKIDSEVTAVSSGMNVSMPDDMKNDNKLGIVFGTDISFPSVDGFSFNIEGRFLDDNALSGYLKYNF